MQYFDLHCDTLYRAVTENSGLAGNSFHISLNHKDLFDKWTQCFAIWIPDGISNQEADALFINAVKKLNEESERNSVQIYNGKMPNSKYTAVFTVEGGRIIGNDLSKIRLLVENNVKILTLTWNGDNDIACGAKTLNDTGLTTFGKKAIKELERNKIIIDTSHLSDKSFYDVADIATAPIIASHSNSRAICSNKRNLTDEQFKTIRDCGGIVGLNFYKDFLNNDGESSDISDIAKHCEHFLSLGGENTVAIGTDFDGADMPKSIKGITSIPEIYEFFLKLNYSETLLNKLFWANAANFFETFDNRSVLL